MEFKGAKGKWTAYSDIVEVENSAGYSQIVRSQGLFSEQIEQENLNLIADAGNVRQQINCSLTELLEQRNYILSHLKVLHLYIELLKKGGDFNNLLHCATERIINEIDNKKQA